MKESDTNDDYGVNQPMEDDDEEAAHQSPNDSYSSPREELVILKSKMAEIESIND